MTWLQPWAIGGGPAIQPAVMRMVTFSNPNKGEGILNVGDLQVVQTPTASGNILVRSGGAAILNRSAGGVGQTYIARNEGDDQKAVPNVGSAARSDLVVARIIDPQYAPWTTPSDPLTATYIETYVVQNVPSTTTKLRQLNNGAGLGYSAIPLARIDRPAGATSVTQAQIKSLREVANPRRQRFLNTKALTTSGQFLSTSATTYEQWPDTTVTSWSVDVPDWATQMRFEGLWSGVYVPAGLGTKGSVLARIGYDADVDHVDSQPTGFDPGTVGNSQRTTFVAGDTRAVPKGLRDRSVGVSLRGRYNEAVPSAYRIGLDAASYVRLDIEFLEAATEDL